jgi:hypothetical protein
MLNRVLSGRPEFHWLIFRRFTAAGAKCERGKANPEDYDFHDISPV